NRPRLFFRTGRRVRPGTDASTTAKPPARRAGTRRMHMHSRPSPSAPGVRHDWHGQAAAAHRRVYEYACIRPALTDTDQVATHRGDTHGVQRKGALGAELGFIVERKRR